MADLSDEPLDEAEMTTWFEMIKSLSPDHLGRAHEMLYSAIAEIRRRRSAVPASNERVREVVFQAIAEYARYVEGPPLGGQGNVATDIATRVAEQLATASVLSEDERRVLLNYRNHFRVADPPDHIKIIDRLLATGASR